MPISLIELSAEVLLEITSNVRNLDLDNFTSTCRFIRSLAANSLRTHQERKALYAKITYGDSSRNDARTTWMHPTFMLRDFLREDLFCYPRKLSIYDHSYSGADWEDSRNYDSDDNVSITSQLSEVSKALVCVSEHLKLSMIPVFQQMDGDEDLTCDILEKGDIGATLGLLLNHLPNLTTLSITDFNEQSNGMGNLKQILDSILADSNDRTRTAAMGPTQPLGKLRQVHFTRSDQGMEGDLWDLEMWSPLFYLPSVRSVSAEYVRAGDAIFNYPGVNSAIEQLVFKDCELNVQSFDTYLKDIKHLRHFESHHQESSQSNPRMIVQKLQKYASHSLQYLKISDTSQNADHAGDGRFFVGSLKAFQNLKTISLEGFMFIEPSVPEKDVASKTGSAPAGRYCNLTDVLPTSAVDVYFLPRYADEVPGVDSVAALAMLQKLQGSKAEFLPYLKSIAILCDVGLHKIKCSAVMKSCRDAGVEVSDELEILN
ncbi:MAG: hypothetical protein Q9176_007471 [Flavoplaca citrina]